jgi:hypothetical protein
MSKFKEKTGHCLNCKIDTRFVLHMKFSENGAQSFAWVCSRCNRFNPAGDRQQLIPRETIEKYLTPEEVETLPTIMPQLYGRCAVCGSRGASLHHWGPKVIFGRDEAEKWPKDYLCQRHHSEWHSKVTPGVTAND